MKIIYTIRGTFGSGGMERVLANKTNYLVRQGHEVLVITTDQEGQPSYFDFDPAIKMIDLKINYASTNGKGLLKKALGYVAKQRLHLRRLEELLIHEKADIVVSLFDNDANLLWKIKDGSRKVAEIHFSRFKRLQYNNQGLKGWVDRYRSRMEARTASHYDAFVVLTQEDKTYWEGLHNIRVIPNANSFEPDTTAELAHKTVIAVGRFDYQKGFDELIKIWSVVHKTCPDWRLKIFGHGELKDMFQSLINNLQLREGVSLCSPTKNIEQEYLNSSILAMTSRYEGLPMALLEAQACGLPLVSYACKCGPRDIIGDGINGYLLQPGDQKGMAERLVTLMKDADLRKKMGQEAKRRSKSFSEESVMKKWLALFEELYKA